jgi:hypothetical protein
LKYGPDTGLALPTTWVTLSDPAGVPDEPVDRGVDEGVGLRGREPLAGAQLGDELLAAALEDLGDAVDDLPAVVRRARGPAAEGLARGLDRVAGVLAGGLGGVGHQLARGIVDDVRAARLRAGELAADVELVGLLHVDARHQPCAPFR